MAKQLSSGAKTSKRMKQELQEKFPGIKFSVRYESYTGGDNLNVKWNLGPTSDQVDNIIKKYQHGYFDGMTDSYEYTGDTKVVTKDGELETIDGVKFVFSNREFKTVAEQQSKDWYTEFDKTQETLLYRIAKDLAKQYKREWVGYYTNLFENNTNRHWEAYSVARRIADANQFDTDKMVSYEGLKSAYEVDLGIEGITVDKEKHKYLYNGEEIYIGNDFELEYVILYDGKHSVNDKLIEAIHSGVAGLLNDKARKAEMAKREEEHNIKVSHLKSVINDPLVSDSVKNLAQIAIYNMKEDVQQDIKNVVFKRFELIEDVRMPVDFPSLNKNEDLERYKKEYENDKKEGKDITSVTKIEQVLIVNDVNYALLANCLMCGLPDVWKNIGGSSIEDSVMQQKMGYTDAQMAEYKERLEKAPYAAAGFTQAELEVYRKFYYISGTLVYNEDSKESFVVDSDGRDYARYVGFPVNQADVERALLAIKVDTPKLKVVHKAAVHENLTPRQFFEKIDISKLDKDTANTVTRLKNSEEYQFIEDEDVAEDVKKLMDYVYVNFPEALAIPEFVDEEEVAEAAADAAFTAKMQLIENLTSRLELIREMHADAKGKKKKELADRMELVQEMLNEAKGGVSSGEMHDLDWFKDAPKGMRSDDAKKENITQERVNKLRACGLSDTDVKACFWGYPVVNPDIKADAEFTYWPSGLVNYREDYVDNTVNVICELVKAGTFEIGLKSPKLENWKEVFEKHGISTTPFESVHHTKRGDRDYEYHYAVFTGNGFAISKSLGYEYFENGKKAGGDASISPVDNFEMKGGYWGIVSRDLDKLKALLFDLFANPDSYCKDLDWLYNGSGGMGAQELEEANVKYRKGGSVYSGRSAKQIWDNWSHEQRVHFLTDHEAKIAADKEAHGQPVDKWENVSALAKYEYGALSVWIKDALNEHISEGQYRKGGWLSRLFGGNKKDEAPKPKEWQVNYTTKEGQKEKPIFTSEKIANTWADNFKKLGYTNVEVIPLYVHGGALAEVSGHNLVFEKWDKDAGGISGTIRTYPENYWVATITSDGSIKFDSWETMVENIDKAKVEELWTQGAIPEKSKHGRYIDYNFVNPKKEYNEGEWVVIKDTYGDFTIVSKIAKKHEQDGVTVYDVEGHATYTADELKPYNFERGGEIENQYKGILDREIWAAWDENQRRHFLLDHFYNDTNKPNEGRVDELVKTDWYNLPIDVQVAVEMHRIEGQYEDGGQIVTWDFDDKGNLSSTVNGTVYTIVADDDTNGSTYSLYIDGERFLSGQPVQRLKEVTSNRVKKDAYSKLLQEYDQVGALLDDETDKAKKEQLRVRLSELGKQIHKYERNYEAGGSLSDFYAQVNDLYVDKKTFDVITREGRPVYRGKTLEESIEWAKKQYAKGGKVKKPSGYVVFYVKDGGMRERSFTLEEKEQAEAFAKEVKSEAIKFEEGGALSGCGCQHMAEGGQVGGSGWGKFKKGKKLKSLDELNVGDILLYQSRQFNAKNVIKVTNLNESHPANKEGRRIVYAQFANPNNISEKRHGWDVEFAIWEHDLKHSDFFWPVGGSKKMEDGGEINTTIPYQEFISHVNGEIDLTKSRDEHAMMMAKNAAKQLNKRVTKRLIEYYRSDSGAFHKVRDILEDMNTRNFNDVVEKFKKIYPLASSDWRSALRTGLVIKAESKEGNYTDGEYIFQDDLAKQIREAGLNGIKPIVENITGGIYAEGGSVTGKDKKEKFEIGATVYDKFGNPYVVKKVREDGVVFAKDKTGEFKKVIPFEPHELSMAKGGAIEFKEGGYVPGIGENKYLVFVDDGSGSSNKTQKIEVNANTQEDAEKLAMDLSMYPEPRVIVVRNITPQKITILNQSYRSYNSGGQVNVKKKKNTVLDKRRNRILRKCDSGTTIQSLVFENDHYSRTRAKNWAKKNGFKFDKIDETENTYRIRQSPPSKFKKDTFRTIEITYGIKAITACPVE